MKLRKILWTGENERKEKVLRTKIGLDLGIASDFVNNVRDAIKELNSKKKYVGFYVSNLWMDSGEDFELPKRIMKGFFDGGLYIVEYAVEKELSYSCSFPSNQGDDIN